MSPEAHRGRARRIRYGLGAVFVGVLLPLAAGVPDASAQMKQYGTEIALVAASAWLFATILLAVAAVVGDRERELLLAIGAVSLLIAHPMLDQIDPLAARVTIAGRHVLAAVAIMMLMNAFHEFNRTERMIGHLVTGITLIAVAFWTIELGSAVSWAGYSATVAMGLSGVVCGSLALFVGQRRSDGAMIAVGLGALSLGYGQALGLLGGGPGTISVTLLGAVAAVLSATAALLAVMEAVNRRQREQEATGLAHTLELARLNAQSNRFAEVAHDHSSALLAIEAAAGALSEHPSGELAAALVAESQRLRRELSGATQDAVAFELGAVITPVVRSLEPLHGQITIMLQPEVSLVGYPDRVAQILRTLIDNAHEHGGGPVAVYARGDDHNVTIRVTDSGDGVPDAYREAIFDRGITTAPRRHSGLGLYNARRLARESGGDLRVSDHDAATFELTLPTASTGGAEIDLRDQQPTITPFDVERATGS